MRPRALILLCLVAIASGHVDAGGIVKSMDEMMSSASPSETHTICGLDQLFTPCLLLDEGIMQRNIDRAADHSSRLAVPLRPHFKTPKSIEVAERLLARNAEGLTVSTLREAEYCLDHGISDLFYAVELAPHKTAQVCALIERGANLACLVDSIECAQTISARAGATTVPLLVGLDLDGYRCGLDPAGQAIIDCSRFINDQPNLEFRGLMAYAGASYHLNKATEKGHLIQNQLSAALSLKRELDFDCPVISLGSTPAFMNAENLTGATEIRGGIYVFQDLFQAGQGHCAILDIALSVLTRVISVQEHRNRFFIDAGALALSKDTSTKGYDYDAAYGLVCNVIGGQPIDDLVVIDVQQEHGIVTSKSGQQIDFETIQIDGLFRVLPNHSDMTAAAYEEYYVIDKESLVRDIWHRANGWAPLSSPTFPMTPIAAFTNKRTPIL
jgi:D-serine deaminase-like pyridoxal phosphate-dependent protein